MNALIVRQFCAKRRKSAAFTLVVASAASITTLCNIPTAHSNPISSAFKELYKGELVLPSDNHFDKHCEPKDKNLTVCYVAHRPGMLRQGDFVPVAALREEDKSLGVYLYTVFVLHCKSGKVLYRIVDGREPRTAKRDFRVIDWDSKFNKAFNGRWKEATNWRSSIEEKKRYCFT
jgi:hypothetical protein